MSNSYRFILIAFGLVLFCTNHAYGKGGKETEQANQSTEQSLQNISSRYDEQAERAKRTEQDEGPCGQRKYGSNADLCAQWKAADAASDSARWAWLGALVGVGSLAGVLVALGLAFHSNWIARDTAKSQLRPYVHSKQVDWQLRSDRGQQYIDFKIRFVNSGQTPANDLQLFSHIYLSKNGPIEVNVELAIESQKQPLGPSNEIFTSDQSIDVDNLNAVWLGENRLFIAGVARYSDNFSNKVKETRCHYEITLGKTDDTFSWVWWVVVGSHNNAT